MIKKLSKVATIICFSLLILWAGSRFHLLVQKGNADIFDLVYGGSKYIPDFREGGVYSHTGKSIVNGVPFTYSVEVVDAEIKEVLDYYKNLYNPPFIRIFTDKQLEEAGVKPGDDAFRAIRFFETIFAKMAPPVLEFRGETFGALGVIDIGDNTKVYIDKDRYKKVVPKVVMAFKDKPYSSKTTVVRYWTDRMIDFRRFIPQGDKDLPGFDLDDIDRHPYSQRLLSLAQMDSFSSSKMVAYRVDDNLDSTIIYYLSDLRGNGWEIPDSVVQALAKKGEKRFIYAKKGNRSVYITFGTDRLNYTSVVMVERYE